MNSSREDTSTSGTNRATTAGLAIAKPVRLLDSDHLILHYLPSTISDDGKITYSYIHTRAVTNPLKVYKASESELLFRSFIITITSTYIRIKTILVSHCMWLYTVNSEF